MGQLDSRRATPKFRDVRLFGAAAVNDHNIGVARLMDEQVRAALYGVEVGGLPGLETLREEMEAAKAEEMGTEGVHEAHHPPDVMDK